MWSQGRGTWNGYDWSLKKFVYKWNIKEMMEAHWGSLEIQDDKLKYFLRGGYMAFCNGAYLRGKHLE